VVEAVGAAEKRLGRDVNPIFTSGQEWDSQENAFLCVLAAEPLLRIPLPDGPSRPPVVMEPLPHRWWEAVLQNDDETEA
jgi:hypothetical protein